MSSSDQSSSENPAVEVTFLTEIYIDKGNLHLGRLSPSLDHRKHDYISGKSYQRRNQRTEICIASVPLFAVLLLVASQTCSLNIFFCLQLESVFKVMTWTISRSDSVPLGLSHVRSAVLSLFSPVQLFVTPRTIAHQAPLSTGFCRQEYWSGGVAMPSRVYVLLNFRFFLSC